MILIDKYAYASNISKTDPVAKLVFTSILLILCLFLNNVWVSIFLLLSSMGFIIYTNPKVNIKTYVKFIIVPASFLVAGILPILIVQDNFLKYTIIEKYNIGITDVSLNLSINLIFRALSAVSITYFLALSTPMVFFLEGLQRLKVPKLFISLMELIYRYIFILLDEAYAIYKAQTLRLGYRNFKSSLYCIGELTATLFIRAYKKADLSYECLLSRGYNGEINTINEEYKSGKVFYYFALMFIIISILIKYFSGRYIYG